jgi:hypothetical protein
MEELTDMNNIKPSPKWITQLGQDIAEKYNLGYVDGLFISGMIEHAILHVIFK